MLTTQQLEGLVEKDWRTVKSRQALEPTADTIGWSYRFTPPFPLVWPPAATAGVVYYGIPYGLAPGRLSEGEHVGEAWVKVELVSSRAPRVVVLREKIQSLGIQGVRPLSEMELRHEREHAQGTQHLAVLTGLGADIDPQRHRQSAAPQRRDPRRRRRLATIVEPQPVDHCAILDQAEQSRLGISLLRQRGQRPNFDRAKAEARHDVRNARVFVEPRRETDGIGKGDSRHFGCEHRRRQRAARPRQAFEPRQRQIVRCLAIAGVDQPAHQPVETVGQGRKQ